MARYIIADPRNGTGWPHIFTEYDLDRDAAKEHERIVGFVYDTQESRFVSLDVEGASGTPEQESDMIEDFEANDMFADPSAWDLGTSDELPEPDAPSVASR